MSNLREKIKQTLEQARTVVFGQDALLEGILQALICEGHLLIEGLPGMGKTLSVNVMSRLCDLNFQRIQFTPDLLPSDLIGTVIYNQAKEEFTTRFGPIFTQILLADEINRAPAKVQSALLEAMAEKQVTIGDKTHLLSAPFTVLATQNPIEQEGTYRLPEAQLDRFMMKIDVSYPTFEEEIRILDLKKSSIKDLNPLLSTDDLFGIQEEMEGVYVDAKIKEFIVRIINSTRPESKLFSPKLKGAILSGSSPRGGIWLLKMAKFMAYLEGKDFVGPEHVLAKVPEVLGHRIMLSYEAKLDGLSPKDLSLNVAKQVV